MGEAAFGWLVTAMIAALFVIWVSHDAPLLVRLLRDTEKRSDLAHRDKIFGSIIGLTLCALGVFGAIKYHMGW